MKANIQKLCQTISRPLVTNLVFPSLLLFLFSFKPESKSPVIRKEVKIASTFQNIRIDGNITVVLTNEPAGMVIIEGIEKDVEKIRYSVKNNKIIIDAQRKNGFSEITVYLPANRLQTIQVNGDAHITSLDVINADDLRISLNGSSKVEVKTTGKLSFDTPYDYDLIWD